MKQLRQMGWRKLPGNLRKFYIICRVLLLRISKPINDQCFYHIETERLICSANQLTGSYMGGSLFMNGINKNVPV